MTNAVADFVANGRVSKECVYAAQVLAAAERMVFVAALARVANISLFFDSSVSQ